MSARDEYQRLLARERILKSHGRAVSRRILESIREELDLCWHRLTPEERVEVMQRK